VYGITDLQRLHQRLGVISLNIEGVSHALAAAVLSYEGGIGVRNGCFCAHIYLLQLLKVPDNEQRTIRTRLGIGQHSDIPGAIRVSFGLYNTMEEVERLTSVLDMIIEHGWKGDYRDDPRDGSFHPASGKPNFGKYYGW
jgi:cysteine desulfurase/selenocysteine lyase